MTKVYMAGSVHHADDGGHGWREEIRDYFQNIVWVNPLDKYDGNANDVLIQRDHSPEGMAVPEDATVVSSADIVEQDKEYVDLCDAVFVGWHPEIPACGTPMEVLHAWETNTPVVVWIRDGSSFDEVSPWLDYHADYMTYIADEAVEYIEDNV